MIVPFRTSASSLGAFWSLYIMPPVGIVSPLNFVLCSRCVVASRVVLPFPNDCWSLMPFHVFPVHCLVFIQIFCPFLDSWGFSYCSVLRVLYIFWIQVAFQIFTASLCLCILLIVSLAKWKPFWPHHPVYKILASWPGIRPAPPALEAVSLNHCTSR